MVFIYRNFSERYCLLPGFPVCCLSIGIRVLINDTLHFLFLIKIKIGKKLNIKSNGFNKNNVTSLHFECKDNKKN